ncbi:MAG: hypothetical protein ACLSHC_14420 [Bilophila wadsworthia]
MSETPFRRALPPQSSNMALFCLEVAEKGQPKIPRISPNCPALPCRCQGVDLAFGLEPRSLRRHIQIRSKALGRIWNRAAWTFSPKRSS